MVDVCWHGGSNTRRPTLYAVCLPADKHTRKSSSFELNQWHIFHEPVAEWLSTWLESVRCHLLKYNISPVLVYVLSY